MLVWERMTRNPYTVTADIAVPDALRRMHKLQVRRFPVVDAMGQLIGIVAERDLLYASPSPATTLSVHEIQSLLAKLSVAKIMQRDVITVTGDTPVEDAARIMADRKIGGLPVVRNGTLIGIITESDLFKLFQELLGARQQGIRVTLLVSDTRGELAKLTAAITRTGGDILALGTFLGEDPTNALVTLKVAGVSRDTLTHILRPLALELIDVREGGPGFQVEDLGNQRLALVA